MCIESSRLQWLNKLDVGIEIEKRRRAQKPGCPGVNSVCNTHLAIERIANDTSIECRKAKLTAHSLCQLITPHF